MPDNGQEHTTDCNDGFLVTTVRFYALIAVGYFGMFLGTQWRISAGGIKEGLIISHMNRVSKSVVDFFSDKSEEEIQKYIALCEQAELIKN